MKLDVRQLYIYGKAIMRCRSVLQLRTLLALIIMPPRDTYVKGDLNVTLRAEGYTILSLERRELPDGITELHYTTSKAGNHG